MNKQRSLYFGYHPNVPHLFFTSDDQCFLPNNENLAVAHAMNLGNNKVDKVTREDFDKWVATEEGKKELEPAPVKTAAQLLEEAQTAYDKAVEEKATDDVIAELKKKLTAAKVKATKEANKVS